MSTRLVIIFLLCLASSAFSELIPADRLYVGWTNAGVIGGIPVSSNKTINTTLTSTGDATDRTSAINSAISSCTSNQVVQLGAGIFRCDGTINLSNSKGVILRGTQVNGTNATTLDCRSTSRQILFGNGSADWPWDNTGTALSANAPQGTNTLTFSSAAAFTAGDCVHTYMDDLGTNGNGGSNAVLTVDGLDASQRFYNRIASKTSTTITLIDPIPFPMTTAANAGVHIIGDGFAVMSGIEQLRIDASSSTGGNGIDMWNAYNCWLKDVDIIRPYSYNVYQLDAIHCTVFKCRLKGIQNAGSNGAGHLMERSSMNLFENSYITNAFPLIEWNFGCSGNVFAYNLVEDDVSNIGLDDNHGAHCSFNLFEGNVTPDINPDGYFGSVSHETWLRNRVTGTQSRGDSADTDSIAVELKRFSRYYNIVGNILGTGGSWTYAITNSGANGPAIYALGYPNIGNRTYSGTAEPSKGDNWSGYPDDGHDSFQERDLDVQNTVIRKGNYNYADAAVPAGESTGGDTIPDSYYISAKPAWFGTLSWPPFDTGSPSSDYTVYYPAIPAGYRVLNADADPTPDTTPPTIEAVEYDTLTSSSVRLVLTTGEACYAGATCNGESWTNETPSTSFYFPVSGLSASTEYGFTFYAADAAGNQSTNGDTFTTLALPAPSARKRGAGLGILGD